jgi:hypothetical protein
MLSSAGSVFGGMGTVISGCYASHKQRACSSRNRRAAQNPSPLEASKEERFTSFSGKRDPNRNGGWNETIGEDGMVTQRRNLDLESLRRRDAFFPSFCDLITQVRFERWRGTVWTRPQSD